MASRSRGQHGFPSQATPALLAFAPLASNSSAWTNSWEGAGRAEPVNQSLTPQGDLARGGSGGQGRGCGAAARPPPRVGSGPRASGQGARRLVPLGPPDSFQKPSLARPFKPAPLFTGQVELLRGPRAGLNINEPPRASRPALPRRACHAWASSSDPVGLQQTLACQTKLIAPVSTTLPAPPSPQSPPWGGM